MHRLFGAFGAGCGLAAVAMTALFAHGLAERLDVAGQQRVVLACAMAALHGLLLLQVAALARQSGGLLLVLAGWLLVAGVLLFCGSLFGATLLGWPTLLAPFGGVTLLLGWLVLAIWFVGAPRR